MNVIVSGPASSGTRFVSRWLEAHPDVVARHWSQPSGEHWAKHWPSSHDFGGERPDAMVMVIRSFHATCESQVARGIAADRADAEAQVRLGLLRTLAWAESRGLRLYPLLYDEVVAHPDRFADVFRWLDVEPVDCPEAITDGSSRYHA